MNLTREIVHRWVAVVQADQSLSYSTRFTAMRLALDWCEAGSLDTADRQPDDEINIRMLEASGYLTRTLMGTYVPTWPEGVES